MCFIKAYNYYLDQHLQRKKEKHIIGLQQELVT